MDPPALSPATPQVRSAVPAAVIGHDESGDRDAANAQQRAYRADLEGQIWAKQQVRSDSLHLKGGRVGGGGHNSAIECLVTCHRDKSKAVPRALGVWTPLRDSIPDNSAAFSPPPPRQVHSFFQNEDKEEERARLGEVAHQMQLVQASRQYSKIATMEELQKTWSAQLALKRSEAQLAALAKPVGAGAPNIHRRKR